MSAGTTTDSGSKYMLQSLFCMCAAPYFVSFQALDILPCRFVQFPPLIILPTLCVKLSVLSKILNAVPYAQNIYSPVNFQHLLHDKFLRML
jgi:hypothetical protein